MKRKGFTLVEMLVVVGIIGVLSAIAIPTAMQLMGARTPIDKGAGQLISILKAARTYAGTYNVDTAVVYNVEVITDSWSGENCEVLTAVAVARRMTRNEFDSIVDGYIDGLVRSGASRESANAAGKEYGLYLTGSESLHRMPFLAVGGVDHAWRRLPDGAVIGCNKNAPPMTPALSPHLIDWKSKSGLCPVRVLDNDLSIFAPTNPFWVDWSPEDTLPPDGWEPTPSNPTWVPDGNVQYALERWPATIFTPEGYAMEPPNSSPRLTFCVVPSPDLDTYGRMAKEGERPYMREVEVFSTLGRIQAVD